MLFFDVLWPVRDKFDWQLEHFVRSPEFQFRATALVLRMRLDVSVAPGEEDIVFHVVHF